MPFRNMLLAHYEIQTEDKRQINGKEGYKQSEYIYFIIPADDREILYMEQAALAYYLTENEYDQTAVPVQNIHGEWFTSYQDRTYMVIRANQYSRVAEGSPGETLAHFHQIGSKYQFEPQHVSSYGQWKQLWIHKLTQFEHSAEENAAKNPTPFNILVIDSLPYIIGISENAIQFLQESEKDYRFHESDEGTIAFSRYINQLHQSFIWPHDLVYDHPVRDLAETIRYSITHREQKGNIYQFLQDYQTVRPLSVFSWRLLYARLLFPAHFFDAVYTPPANDPEEKYLHFKHLIEQQGTYEKTLRNFFADAGMEREPLGIPTLHWL
ncbi:protein kinase family protein [Virgibacillus kimchii]